MAKLELAKLELALLVGDESKQFLQNLTTQIDRLEKLVGKSKEVVNEEKEKCDDDETEDDEDFGSKKEKKKVSKKAESFDDDDEGCEGDVDGVSDAGTEDDVDDVDADADETSVEDNDDEFDDDLEPAPKKRGRKPKKVSLDQVKEACKAKIARGIERGMSRSEAHAKVLDILKKKFGASSTSALKEDQYADVVKTMEAKK